MWALHGMLTHKHYDAACKNVVQAGREANTPLPSYNLEVSSPAPSLISD
jgi:hypothetical protein